MAKIAKLLHRLLGRSVITG